MLFRKSIELDLLYSWTKVNQTIFLKLVSVADIHYTVFANEQRPAKRKQMRIKKLATTNI